MLHAILFGIALILFGGFLLLVALERKKGVRVAGGMRAALDKKVGRAAFIARHVDWGAFVRHLAGTALERVLHDVAHAVLQFVRASERVLTRAVRRLRERRGLAAEGAQDAEERPTSPIARGIEKVRRAWRSSRRAPRPKALRKPRADDQI